MICQVWGGISRINLLFICNSAVGAFVLGEVEMVLMRKTDGNYTFPTPDWMFSNASWAAEQLDIYNKNRTGKYKSDFTTKHI